jgi:hypothetical protein
MAGAMDQKLPKIRDEERESKVRAEKPRSKNLR